MHDITQHNREGGAADDPQQPRHRLPSRRASETFDLESQGLKFSCTASWFEDGALAEIFLQNHKADSMAGVNAKDAAIVCSLALQHGTPLETIRRALTRDQRGRALGPIGTALDLTASASP